MESTLTFKAIHTYDHNESGITVPLKIVSGAKMLNVDVKLDPGSTFCVFQRLIGEELGFDIERGIPQWIGTATGRFLAYGHEAMLIVLDIETTATVYFAVDEHFPINVLGRTGWLDRLRLGLVDYESHLYLSDYNDPA